jgi:hypothetical protein
MVKKFIWRLQEIEAGVTKEELSKYFEDSEKGRVAVKTLCACVDDPHRSLTATFEYTHDPDAVEPIPRLRDDTDAELDRDFVGFTPLYSPDPGTHDAEYVVICVIGASESANTSVEVSSLLLALQAIQLDHGLCRMARCGSVIFFLPPLLQLVFLPMDMQPNYKAVVSRILLCRTWPKNSSNA